MSDINEQQTSPRIWIEQMLALRVICNQVFHTVLDALLMSDSKFKDTCGTYVKGNLMLVSDINQQLTGPRNSTDQAFMLNEICDQVSHRDVNALLMSDPECQYLTCNQLSCTVLDALLVSDPKCQDDCKTCVKENLMTVKSESPSPNSLLLKGSSLTDAPNFNGKEQLNFIDDEASQNITNHLLQNHRQQSDENARVGYTDDLHEKH